MHYLVIDLLYYAWLWSGEPLPAFTNHDANKIYTTSQANNNWTPQLNNNDEGESKTIKYSWTDDFAANRCGGKKNMKYHRCVLLGLV